MGKNICRAKGVILSLDIAIAILLMIMAIAASYTYYYSGMAGSGASLDSRLQRSFAQDTATVLSKQGYLTAPLASNSSDTSGIREVLRATPGSLCMQVAAYGTIVPDRLIGYWKLDEDSGTTAFDSSGNHFVGTVQSAPANFSEGGISGRALYFNGTGSYVSISNDSRLKPQSMTIAAWAKPNKYTGLICAGCQRKVVFMDSGYSLEVGTSDDPRFMAYTDIGGWVVASSPEAIQWGQWSFLAGTYDPVSGTMNIYVDGQLKGTTVVGASGISYGNDTLLISNSGTPLAPYEGLIDEVRIYDRVLSQDEISSLYSNPSNLLYVVDKPGCTYSGGAIQAVAIPFAYNKDQLENDYCRAIFKVWQQGGRA